MEERLKLEQEKLFLKNMALVRYLVAKKFNQSNYDFEELIDIGNFGLFKASRTFDASKGITFGTYASTCIMNEIGMYLRKEKKYENNISLDEPISDNGKNKELTLSDTLSSSDIDFTEEIISNEAFVQLITIILNFLNSRERLIMLYKISGTNQNIIAKKLSISQSYISRLEKAIANKIKLYFSTMQQFKKVFSIKIIYDSYNISFSLKDVKNFNQIFVSFLQNLESNDGLSDLKIIRNKERITIVLSATLESFYFIAQLMEEFDE